jgi:hypothetical protein
MRAEDFFVVAEPDPFGMEGAPPYRRLDESLLEVLRKGPLDGISDESAASGLLDLVQDQLERYGTDGSQELTDAQIELAIRSLQAVTSRVAVALEIPFRNFTRFRSHWMRNGASGSWQARRDILEELFEPARNRLVNLESRPIDARLPAASLADLRDPSAIQEQLQRIQRASTIPRS